MRMQFCCVRVFFFYKKVPKRLKRLSPGPAALSDCNDGQHAATHKLLEHHATREDALLLRNIRFNAPHKVRRRAFKSTINEIPVGYVAIDVQKVQYNANAGNSTWTSGASFNTDLGRYSCIYNGNDKV